jgi:hypothetical protein
MNNCVTVWIQNALDALSNRIQQLSNYTEILSLYYNWDALNIFDFPNLQYTPVATRGILYQGFYGNQLLNVYADEGLSTVVGNINFNQNFLEAIQNPKSPSPTYSTFDQESVMLSLQGGNIQFIILQNSNFPTNGYLQNTNPLECTITGGTGDYANIQGYVVLQRLSLKNQIRSVRVYKKG